MTVSIPVGVGELIDKLTILIIKKKKITDPAKLYNIETEYEALNRIYDPIRTLGPSLHNLMAELQVVNETIWDIEDSIRKREMDKDFGYSFIELARGVYHNNDERSRIKREINDLMGSEIVEEKSYTEYK